MALIEGFRYGKGTWSAGGLRRKNGQAARLVAKNKEKASTPFLFSSGRQDLDTELGM